MTRKILITGGAGNLGASLAKRLLTDNNNELVVVDNLLTGKREKLPTGQGRNFHFHQMDVNSLDEISELMNSQSFDLVFHYAAVVGVKRTLDDPISVLNDIDGIKNILNLSVETNVQQVFFSSSSEVYGEPFEIPQNELSTPLNSRLPYAIVKNLGEAYCRAYRKIHSLNYTIMRFFNTYGPLQSQDFVIPIFIKQALANDDITLNGDGCQTRTFLYIDDNLAFIKQIMDEKKCIDQTINIGSDYEISIRDLAKLIIKITGSQSKIVHLPALKEGDMTRRKPDISKMKSIIGRELTSLETGIKKLLDHFDN